LVESRVPTACSNRGSDHHTRDTYGSVQTVTLSVAGPPTEIRYTINGSDPTATLTFNYGALNPPAASPGTGVYQPTQSIALTAASGATIRYTTDGSDPTAVSNLYVSPLSLPAGATTLKAKAFHPDWTASATMTETFTLDGTAPTIRAATFPYAVGGWYTAPVTVSFTCIDASGIATCSTPVTVSQEGTTVVSGTATDLAGNTTSANVTINLDTVPPEVALASPTGDVSTTAATIELSGSVSDVGSGVSVASCNGVPVTPVSGQLTCTVPLRPGRNTVVLVARDAAGNNVSAGVRVTRTGTPTTLTLAPGTRTLLVDEAATLSLSDDYGLNVAPASWVASDPSVVSLSTDDPPVLTALAAGSATITATKNGLSSIATLTVVSGTSLPDGTTRWSVPPTPGLEMTSPIYTHVVDETVPNLFTVETDPITNESTMRALTASGEQKWVEAAPGLPVMGDSFGGVVAQTPDVDGTPAGLARLGGPVDAPPWRYEPAGAVKRPAQAPDGTLYALEEQWGTDSHGYVIQDLVLVVIDGETGHLRARVPLPRDFVEFYAEWEGQFVENVGTCRSDRWEMPSQATTPVVGTDGFGYLEVRRTTRVDHGYCVDTDIYARADDHTLQLLKVSPQGVATWTTLYEFTGSSNPWWPATGQVLPDGVGGMLATWKRYRTAPAQEEWTITRFDDTGARSDFAGADDTYVMLTAQEGKAYLFNDGMIEARDVATWESQWTATYLGTPVVACDDGGLAVHNESTGELFRTSGAGASTSLGLMAALSVSRLGLDTWVGVATSGGLVAERFQTTGEASSFRAILGNPQGQNSQTVPDVVITVNVFIPEEYLDDPFPLQPYTGAIFEGDNRAYFRRLASSRVHQEVFVTLNGASSLVKMGTTRQYDKASSLDPNGHLTLAARQDTVLGDTYLKTAEETDSGSGVTVSATRSGSVASVQVAASAGNPFRHIPLIENTIDYEFAFAVDFGDKFHPQFSMTGAHDGFPNYEVYMNGQLVYAYIHAEQTPFSLFPPMEFVVGPIAGSVKP
jgi:Chitobiase/beta-hexosaminidase C-terminal domain